MIQIPASTDGIHLEKQAAPPCSEKKFEIAVHID